MFPCVLGSDRLRDPEIIDEHETSGHAYETLAIHDDGYKVSTKQRNKLANWCIGRDGFKSRDHYVFHRQIERARSTFKHRTKHVALVNETDNAIAVHHRQLRDIGSTHAH